MKRGSRLSGRSSVDFTVATVEGIVEDGFEQATGFFLCGRELRF